MAPVLLESPDYSANLSVFSIFTIENLSTNLLYESIPLMHTPRNLVRHPTEPLFYVIESDNNTLAAGTREQLLNDPSAVNGESKVLPPEEFGYPKGRGHWASCIQVVDPITNKEVVHTLELSENECAVSVCLAPFASQNDETFLVVGTAKDLIVAPRSYTCGYVHVYRLHENGRELEFIHKTKTEAPPMALLPFQGKILVAVLADLRLYDLGLRQLLRKAQALNVVPNILTGLQTQGSRIICSDVQESVTYVVYKHVENRLIPFCDDNIHRWTTCTTMVDYETTAGGDKFGNIWLVRCPPKISEEADEEGSGLHLINERPYLQGTPNRLDLLAHFYTQDMPTSIQKTALVAGGRELLLWSGLQGTLGIFIPFVGREDVDFFQSLEQHLRTDDPPIAGRDHLAFRSYYVPVKGVIDGDLCERFLRLPRDKKESIAAELDRSVREVERKIGDQRTRFAY